MSDRIATVVHNEEEFKALRNWNSFPKTYDEALKRYPEGVAITDKGYSYCGIDYFKREGYKLINEGENMSTKQYNLGDVIEVKNFIKRITTGAHREYKDGELFVVVDEVAVQENSKLKLGQIVRLGRNDNSTYPYFDTTPNSNRDACIKWGHLAELPVDAVKKAKVEKPVALVTRTEYSDGVIVSEEAITFDGQTFTRENLKKLVTRYQEVLRRPVGTVIAPKTVAKKKASKK